MPANWDGGRISGVLRISTHIICNEPLTTSIGILRFSRAAGYLPASIVDASIFNIMTYNT